jgi:hypothetical protein
MFAQIEAAFAALGGDSTLALMVVHGIPWLFFRSKRGKQV